MNNEIERLLHEGNGILKTSDIVCAGIPKETFYRYIRNNGFERAAQGIYLSPEALVDEFILLQLQFPKLVFSHETALYLHDLAEMEPMPLSVTVDSKYNCQALADKGVQIFYTKKVWHSLGVCEMPSPSGHLIRVYNQERTVCDIIRKREHMDVSVFNFAIREYVKRKDRNYLRLAEYAKAFHIERQLRDVMGVLL